MNNRAMRTNRDVDNWIQAMLYIERDGWVVSICFNIFAYFDFTFKF